MRITYLLNSGFAVEERENLLVFDAFDDPANALERILQAHSFAHIYFFASHSHFDHFNGQLLAKFSSQATAFFLSSDIRRSPDASLLPKEKIIWLAPYEEKQYGGLLVESFSSTDLGTSFRVSTDTVTLFHAGDFNWWDWIGDTHENRQLAANGFHKQLKKLAGMTADVAFFPVDGRLGPSMAKGAKEFVAATNVRALITMHSVGYSRWQVPVNFFVLGHEIPVWSPVSPGEEKDFVHKG